MTSTAAPTASNTSDTRSLSTGRGIALYVGALLGPCLLLLPGLAAQLAGPASVLAWAGLLVLSGLLAWVFTALGTRLPTAAGVAGFTAAGLGPRAGRAVGWCFLAGAVFGAPVVCLMGGGYVAALFGGDTTTTVLAAVVLLAVVVALTLGGARVGTTVQVGLVVVLVALVAVAVLGAAPAATAAHWTPFAPHGWSALGPAAAALMLSFVGWEAIAPLTGRLREPRRSLPRVIGGAFAITTVVYLALAVTTIGVLGDRAGSAVPLADLLQVAIGRFGPLIAAVAAVALTLAATNAYLTGAAALATELRRTRGGPDRPGRLQLGIAVTGVVLLAAVAAGVVSTTDLVTVPAALFVTVYLGAAVAAVRVLRGRVRVAAGVAAAVVAMVLACTGWAMLVAAAVVAAAALPTRATTRGTRSRRPHLPTAPPERETPRHCRSLPE